LAHWISHLQSAGTIKLTESSGLPANNTDANVCMHKEGLFAENQVVNEYTEQLADIVHNQHTLMMQITHQSENSICFQRAPNVVLSTVNYSPSTDTSFISHMHKFSVSRKLMLTVIAAALPLQLI
jgi:hypothetical protein